MTDNPNVTVYPPGPATVLAVQLALEHVDPWLSFTSLDRKRTFHISGPQAPWPGAQDGIQMLEITPPTPDFKHLKAKGARQHGATWNTSTFNEGQINLVLKAYGTTPERLGQVVSDWVSMWHPHRLVRFEWLTFDKGLWWCDVRLSKAWTDRIQNSPRRHKQQVLTHVVDVEKSFWESVDSASWFGFDYEDMTDTFTTNYSPGMGPGWPLRYTGTGPGYIYTAGGDLRWHDDSSFGTNTQEVIFGPRAGFDTDTDNQVVSVVIDSPPEWSIPDNGKFFIGARMNRKPDNTWNGDGVFAEIGTFQMQVVRYNNYVRTVMWDQGIYPPLWGEKFTLVAGQVGSPRKFKVLRNGTEILSRTESGTGSAVGATHRGVGGGMSAGGALITQASPAVIRKISAGDNATVTQSGFLTLSNIGSEDGWPQVVFRGPGTVGVGNGPGSTDMITFGPINDGQQVLISTHPRYRNVIDLTTAGTLTGKQQEEVTDMAAKVALGQVPPQLAWYESVFGVLPPQGNLYELLDGRFTRPIPGVEQPSETVTSKIAVSIVDGNADSRVMAAVTPQRRWPE